MVAQPGRSGRTSRPDMTVVFDAGQNSDANFPELATTDLHYVGSVPASDCPDLLALPAKTRRPVPGYPGLTAIEVTSQTPW